MAYAAIADYETRFNSTETQFITDRANSGSINNTVLQAGLDDAFGLMNSWIGRRYVLPITGTASGAMISCQCDLTRWLLYIGDKPDAVQERYKYWESWLEDVASGKVGLGMTDPPATVTGTSSFTQPVTQSDAPGRFFTEDQLEVF